MAKPKSSGDNAGKKKSGGKINLYEILGVKKDATPAELRKAYHRRALVVHPDKAGKSKDDDGKAFQALQEAYEVLKDPAKRKRYDRTGSIESDTFLSAYERFRGTEVTEKDVDEFLGKFRNSPAEERDVIDYCKDHEGDMTTILSSIIGSGDEDAERFRKIALAATEDGRLPKELSDTIKNSEIMTEAELDAAEEVDINSDDSEDEDFDGEEEDEEEDDPTLADFIVADETEKIEDAAAADDDDDDEETMAPVFAVGTLVEAKWRRGTNWFAGEIVKVHEPAKNDDDDDDDDDDVPELPEYDILYDDDGYLEEHVPANLVRISRQKKRVVKHSGVKKRGKSQTTDDSKDKKAKKAKKSSKDDLADVDPSLLAMFRNRNAARSDAFERFAEKYS